MNMGYDLFCQACERAVPHEVEFGCVIKDVPLDHEPMTDEGATLCYECGLVAGIWDDDAYYLEWEDE